MVRPVLLEPAGGYTPEVVESALLLVGLPVVPPLAVIEQWSPLELMVAFDWAMREHLHASDNPLMCRPRPWFVTAWRARDK
jgi:hypothetical protein